MNIKWKIKNGEAERNVMQSVLISSHSSHLFLHSSFSPSQLSLVFLATPSLLSAAGLFRLGRDKWEETEYTGSVGVKMGWAWGTKRGEGKWRGGTWTHYDRLVRKIKPGLWWRVMNGSHYERFAAWSYWREKDCEVGQRWDDRGWSGDDQGLTETGNNKDNTCGEMKGSSVQHATGGRPFRNLSFEHFKPKVQLSETLSSLSFSMKTRMSFWCFYASKNSTTNKPGPLVRGTTIIEPFWFLSMLYVHLKEELFNRSIFTSIQLQLQNPTALCLKWKVDFFI